MSFLEHLEDLRKRIIYSCIALVGGMAIAFTFMDRLVQFVFTPTRQALPIGTELISSRPTEGLAVYFDIAFMAGLVLAAPVIMYQIWLFVVPALYANEKKFVVPTSETMWDAALTRSRPREGRWAGRSRMMRGLATKDSRSSDSIDRATAASG